MDTRDYEKNYVLISKDPTTKIERQVYSISNILEKHNQYISLSEMKKIIATLHSTLSITFCYTNERISIIGENFVNIIELKELKHIVMFFLIFFQHIQTNSVIQNLIMTRLSKKIIILNNDLTNYKNFRSSWVLISASEFSWLLNIGTWETHFPRLCGEVSGEVDRTLGTLRVIFGIYIYSIVFLLIEKFVGEMLSVE